MSAPTPPAGNPGWIVYDPAVPETPPSTWNKARRTITRELCRRSLGDFMIAGWHVLEEGTPFAWNWHMDVLCDHVQAVLEQQVPGIHDARMPRTGLPRQTCRDLIINVPPGTAKSLVTSVFAVAWMWVRRPSWRVICASGNPAVSVRDSIKTRDLVRSQWYRELFEPKWELASDQDAKTLFKNTRGGTRRAMTAGQAVTGDRADALIVDDPNDAAKVRSEAERTNINEAWWSAAFSNRVNDPKTAVRIIIQQRVHEEDLTGYILDKNKCRSEGGTWEVLCVPMEYEAGGESCKPTFLGWADPRTAEGELLMPHRFPPAFIAAEKVEKGSAGYAGQYQQRPAPKDGNRFKRNWWRFWRRDGDPLVQPNRPEGCSGAAAVIVPSSFEDGVDSWDLTFKGKTENDWVVGVKVGKKGPNRYILRMWRKHTGFGGAKAGVVELRHSEPQFGACLIEDKANGPAVIEELKKVLSGVVEVNPKEGKEERAAVMEPQVEAGNWFLPDGVHWVEDLVDEFAVFPNGKHDDIVDAISQAAARFGMDSALETAALLCAVWD